jgi:hypothetical protein
VTSNLPFAEWTEVLGSERLTGALLDRLTHHVHILEMNGDSFRLKNSRKKERSWTAVAPPLQLRFAPEFGGGFRCALSAPPLRASQGCAPAAPKLRGNGKFSKEVGPFAPPPWSPITLPLTPELFWSRFLEICALKGGAALAAKLGGSETKKGESNDTDTDNNSIGNAEVPFDRSFR